MELQGRISDMHVLSVIRMAASEAVVHCITFLLLNLQVIKFTLAMQDTVLYFSYVGAQFFQ